MSYLAAPSRISWTSASSFRCSWMARARSRSSTARGRERRRVISALCGRPTGLGSRSVTIFAIASGVGVARRAGGLGEGERHLAFVRAGLTAGSGHGPSIAHGRVPGYRGRAMSHEAATRAVALVERLFALLHECRALVPQLEGAGAEPEPVSAPAERLL